MTSPLRSSFALAALVGALSPMFSQEAEDRTLLPNEQMRAIVNEASGERAMHHVLELVPYPRVRPRSEYEQTFRETDVMVRFAKEYGFSNVEVESFPSNGTSWQPTRGELWMVEPEMRKLYDIFDVAISLTVNSEAGDVTAELVDLGTGGNAGDYEGKDLTGKIIMGSAGPGTLQRMGVFDKGAVGVVSYNSLRPDDWPDQILSASISSNAPEGKKPGFGWAIGPRVARELGAIIASGKKVVLRSIIEAQTFPGELEVVHATIPGDGSTDQVVGVSAHLYEGYIKQGANDDNSGCALTLEMGRAYIQLVKDGKLPRPRRTLHFLWVPEISGTNAWLARHEEVKSKMIADLNFDMEGVRLTTSRSYWVLHRTPNSFPTYLNDIGQSLMEWVAEVNRERVRFRSNGYRPSLPITSQNGSQDPFYIKVDKHYGSSDHVVYLQNGIASLMFITWPDMWYHSSQDVPQQLDPTQFRRAAVVGIGGMSILASAGDEMAARVAGESFARGTERMGDAQRKGIAYMADVVDARALASAHKEALNTVSHQSAVEQQVVRSVSPLFASPAAGSKTLEPLAQRVAKRAQTLQEEVTAFYELRAVQMKAKTVRPVMTAEEKSASGMYVERVGGGGRGGMRAAMARLSEDERRMMSAVPQHMTAELNVLIGQKKSVLEIRDFLSGEFEPLPLNDLVSYLGVMEKAGMVKLEKR